MKRLPWVLLAGSVLQPPDAAARKDTARIELPPVVVTVTRTPRLTKGMELKAFVRAENLGDRKHIGSAFLNPDVVNGEVLAFEPGLPRHFVASVSLGWARP